MRLTEGGFYIIRHCFCWIHVCLWLCGCGLVGLGLWLVSTDDSDSTTVFPSYRAVTVEGLALLAGGTTSCLAFLACCGAWFKLRCLVMTYFLLVVVLLSAQFTLGVIVLVFRHALEATLKHELYMGLRQKYGYEVRYTSTWDHIQQKFECCGVNSYKDWFFIKYFDNETRVADSCCHKDAPSDCGWNYSLDDIYEQNCYDELKLWFTKRLHIIAIALLLTLFIEMYGLVSALLIHSSLKYSRQEIYL